MAYKHLPKNLPSILRSVGLQVVELDDWYGNGRPASTGGFNPAGPLAHHTGSYDKVGDTLDDLAYARWLAFDGRSDLPAPLCNLALSLEGVVYICASGRANHAGKAKTSGTVAGGDGNSLYIGIEAMNSGSQGWPKAQYDAYVLLCAVLSVKVTGNSHNTVRAHRETSVTGKWDPGLLNMDKFRADVAAKMKELKGKPVKPAPVKPKDNLDPKNYYINAKGDHVAWLKTRLVAHGFGKGLDLKDPTYGTGTANQVKAFKKAQGYPQRGASDLLPGATTLKALAANPAPKPPPKPAQPKGTVVQKDPRHGWLTMDIATANVGTKATATMFEKAATGCQIVGFQEVDTAGDVRAAQRALENHQIHGLQGNGQHNVATGHDENMWRTVASNYYFQFEGESGISHTRHGLVTELELIADPSIRVAAVSVHYPPAAYSPSGQPRKSGDRIPTRLRMWDEANESDTRLLTMLAKKGIPVVVFGDFNRQKLRPYPVTIAGRKTRAVSSGLDWIVLIDGDTESWELGKSTKRNISSPGHPALVNRVTLNLHR